MSASQFFEAWRRRQAGWPCRFDGHKWAKIGERQGEFNPATTIGVFRCSGCFNEKQVALPVTHINCRCYIESLPPAFGETYSPCL